MAENLHEAHQALKEQLEEFGIYSYIVGQKIEGGAERFRVIEVEHVSRRSSAILTERNKLSFPNWMSMRDGARYMIVRYLDDPRPGTRHAVNETTVFSEETPETDALHAAYVPLEVPLNWLKIDLTALAHSPAESQNA